MSSNAPFGKIVLVVLVILGLVALISGKFPPYSSNEQRMSEASKSENTQRASEASPSRANPSRVATRDQEAPDQSALPSLNLPTAEPLDINSEVQTHAEALSHVDPVSGTKIPTAEDYKRCALRYLACKPWMYLSTAKLDELVYTDDFGVQHAVLLSPALPKIYNPSASHEYKTVVREYTPGDSLRPILLYQNFKQIEGRTHITHYVSRVPASEQGFVFDRPTAWTSSSPN